jgi:hypothetical protein
VLVASQDDVMESWLEGSTSDEESINILLGNKIGCVLVSD